MEFEELLSKYEKQIFNLILRLVSDYEEAADLTQDTFISVYRNLSSFREESSAYTWIYRIAVNLCKNHYRDKASRRRIRPLSIEDVERGYEASKSLPTVDVPPTPWEALDRKELRERIEDAISRLPYDQRVMVVLRDMQGLSYQEIADVVGVSLGVVKTRLSRARAALRKMLKHYLSL